MISLTSPERTPYHAVPAGLKLALLCVATVLLFRSGSLAVVFSALAGVGALYLAAGSAFAWQGLQHLKPLWFFIAVIAIWHGVTGDLSGGALIGGRLVTLVALANLVTMTTRLDAMIAVLTWAMTPLRRLGLRTRWFELAVALVIRFTPVLLIKARTLSDAWRVRSPRRPGWRIIAPFALLAIDDADHVADALRARGGIN